LQAGVFWDCCPKTIIVARLDVLWKDPEGVGLIERRAFGPVTMIAELSAMQTANRRARLTEVISL
jgi:hypothetical protein